MPVSLDGQLVVAISSRALFDFEEENQVFEQSDDRAYMKLQLERLEAPAKPGVAFSLVKKLLAFESGLHSYLKDKHAALLAKLESSKAMDKDAEAEMSAAIVEFKKSFA